MSASGHATTTHDIPVGRTSRRRALFGGGTDGNEQLTAIAGLVLIVLLAALGITILRVRQLIWEHLFLGLLLLGPVMLKMGSTGYRFAKYYTGNAQYRDKGAPELILRAIAPLVVLTTVIVWASGIVLFIVGPKSRGTWLPVHKVSFIMWLGFTGLHVLGHLPRLGEALRAGKPNSFGHPAAGSTGRWIVAAGAIVGGLVLALVLIPHFGIWTAAGAIPNHDH